MASASCPALFLAAPASGQGKTTITAILARLLKCRGKKVFVFKTGPDFLDPQVLAQASGQHVEQLDTWLAGDAWCQQKLYEAALNADVILVEGAMGLFDGEPSSADLAVRFNIPIAIVMDVKGMAQTAAAIATGLANFRNDTLIAGVIANNCGSARHQQLITDALPASLPLLAALKRSEDVALPERHLGLVQSSEVAAELEQCFAAGVDWMQNAGVDKLINKIQPVEFFEQALPVVELLLSGYKIAVAKDEAFTFIYQSNLQLLRDLGAQIQFFSPIHDVVLPKTDAVWLPGGYPELYAKALSENHQMISLLKTFFAQNRPILAECGGFLYCLQTLTDLDDQRYDMAGLITGHSAMRGNRGCQGMQTAPMPEGEIRAHAHHRSRSVNTPEPIAYGIRQRHPAPGEEIYRVRRLTATYLHLFFPSNPEVIANIFKPVNQVSVQGIAAYGA